MTSSVLSYCLSWSFIAFFFFFQIPKWRTPKPSFTLIQVNLIHLSLITWILRVLLVGRFESLTGSRMIRVLTLRRSAAGPAGASASQICWRTVGQRRALRTQCSASGRPAPPPGWRSGRREWRDGDASTQPPYHSWDLRGHGSAWSYGMSMTAEWTKRSCLNPCYWRTLDRWNPFRNYIDGLSSQSSQEVKTIND